MKRHPALQDLSRDHYFVLVRCQQVRKAIGRAPAGDEWRALADDFLAFYESDMVAHFREEDEFVVPEAERVGDDELKAVAKQIHADHEWFKTAFARLRRRRNDAARTQTVLAEIEARLAPHVRTEEERLFEGVQGALSEEEMQSLWKRSFAFRKANRSPAACSIQPPRP